MNKDTDIGALIRTHSCNDTSERQFLIKVFKRAQRGPNGETSVIRVFKTVDNGETWIKLPLRRSPISYLTSRLLTTWPPEGCDGMAIVMGQLCFEYRDMWVPHEPSVAWLWRAIYNSKREWWNLSRVRRMDYERLDAPRPYD